MENIKLLEHQIKSNEYIISRCKRQHGLIINHYMGSGKTITGLVFLKNYPLMKKVIILPKSLINVWKSEAKKFDIKDIIYIPFDKLHVFEKYKDDIKDSICIVDEAHNLYSYIDIFKEKDTRLIDFINTLYSTKKILLMTGTLIRRNNLTDIRWLINIAAGKNKIIVPFDEQTFINKYNYKSLIDKLYSQVLIPFIKYNPINLIPKEIIKTLNLNSNNIIEFIYNIITTHALSLVVNKQLKSIKIESKKGILDLDRYKDILKNIDSTYTKSKLLPILLSFLLVHGVKLIFKYIKGYYEETYTFSKLDPQKLLNDNVNRYISFFNFKYIDTTDYPKIEEKIMRVNYTNKQLILLLKLIGIPENLENSEYVLLEFSNKLNEVDFFKNQYNLKSSFTDKGRIIGNLYKEPEKFKQIVKIYLKNNKEQTVIYSNFYKSGLLLFSKYLKSKNIVFTILHTNLSISKQLSILQDFKDKKINMLLLHPDFYEGISIHGCRALHVIDPIRTTLIREQLFARVVRYKSHYHLDKPEQSVIIYQWGCTLLYDINKILHSKIYLKEWFKSLDSNKTMLNLFDAFKDTLSPDDYILKHYNQYKNFNNNFYKTIGQISIDNSTIPLSCCIWTPDDSCSNKKLKPCI